MSDIRDNFCETLDHSATGIKGSLAKMMHILARVDLELYNDLRSKVAGHNRTTPARAREPPGGP